MSEKLRNSANKRERFAHCLFLLNEREREVIRWAGSGKTNSEIATIMGTSESTIKHYLTTIFDKLVVANRAQLVRNLAAHETRRYPEQNRKPRTLARSPVRAERTKEFSISKSARPPVTAERILWMFLPKRLRSTLIGDLEEEFKTIIVPKHGLRYGRVWYWKQAASSVGPILWRQLTKLAILTWLGKAASWLYGKLGS